MRLSRRTAAVLLVGDRLDHASLEQIRREISEAVSTGGAGVVIDLSAVGPVNNDTLCRLCRTLRGVDGVRVQVTGADLRVQRVLTVCAIDGLELAPVTTSRPLRSAPEFVRFLRARARRVLARLLDIERFPSRPLS